MSRKSFKVMASDGGSTTIKRVDETYDKFTVTSRNDRNVIMDVRENLDIYEVMKLSMEAYEHFKADQQGVPVSELYNS